MTTENILINIREDGARVVVVNINAIATASASASNSVAGLSRALGGLSVVALAKQFFEMADAVTLLDARLKLATRSTEEFNQAQSDIYKMSQANNVGIRETTRLYTKLAEPVRNMGGGMKEVAGIVNAFGTALRVGGANTQEAAAATLQFAQAMNKGKLDGDEFRTMAEVAPRVMRALAEGIGVPVGQLKEMSKAGQLTADVISNALLGQLGKLTTEAATMGNTVGGAFSDLSNDTLIAVGAFDKMSGASAGMADIVQGLSLIVFQLAQVFRDELKDGTKQADTSFETTGIVIKGLGIILETLLVLGSDVSHIFKTIGRDLGGFAAQVGALLRGDFAAVSAIQESIIADNKTATSELERYQGRIIGMTDRALEARDKLKNVKPGEVDTDFKTLQSSQNEGDLIKVRMRLTGITQNYFNDLGSLSKALDQNKISTKEYIALVSELAKKTWDASTAGKAAAKAAKPEPGSDDRIKTMQDQLAQEDTLFSREETIYGKRDKMLTFYHNRLGLSDDDFYKSRQTARDEYLAAEEISYNREKQILESFKLKTANELADNKLKLTKLLQQHVDFYDKLSGARTDDELNQLAAARDVDRASNANTSAYLSSLQDTLEKLKLLNGERELSAAAIERESVATLQLAIDNLKLNNATPLTSDHTEKDVTRANEMIDMLTAELNIRKDISTELDKQQKMKLQDKAAQQLAKDWKEAGRDIAEGLKATFGSVGESLGGVFKAFAENASEQLQITERLKKAVKGLEPDDPQRVKAFANAQQESARNQIKSYADMAGAAKGFFKENTTGYKVLEATEKAYRIWELGITIANAAKKFAVEAASTAKSSALAGTEASAWGITAVVKAIASMPYPANLAAGAATLAAVIAIGAKMSGGISGSGGVTAAKQQEIQGTGTVFGDTTAKSDSIGRSLERLQDQQSNLIPLNQGMLAALRNIEKSMGGLSNLVIRSTGLTTGSNFGIKEGQINIGKPTDVVSKVLDGVTKGLLGPGLGDKVAGFLDNIWGKTTQNIVDTGIQFGGSLKDLQAGKGYNQYASVDKTTSSFFGLAKKTTNSMQTAGLDPEVTNQFSMIFRNMETTLIETGKGIGVGADQITKALDGLDISMTTLSLKGLTGDALTSAISAVISKSLDQMTAAVFPEFEKFRQVGEGYAETVIRVTTNYAKLDQALNSVGKVFGSTGIASLDARESFIAMVGGIDEVSSKFTKYSENFQTKAQQLVPVQDYVTKAFEKMGLVLPKTREGFADLMNAQEMATEKGRENVAGLLNVAEAFALLTPALKDSAKTAQEVTDERVDLQTRYDAAVMTSSQLIEKQRQTIDASNKSLYDQVVAAERAKVVLEERKGIQDQIDQATMSSSELLLKQRAALDESNRVLFDQLAIIKLRDEALARSNSMLAIEAQIYEVTGDKVKAASVLQLQHKAALEALDPALRNATQTLWNVTAAAASVAKVKSDGAALISAVDDGFTVLQTMVNKEKALKVQAYQDELKALEDKITKETDAIAKQKVTTTAAIANYKALSDAIRSTLDGMKVSGDELGTRQAAQQQVRDALTRAKAGGGLPNAEDLKGSLSTLAQDSSEMFGSMKEYYRDFYKTQNDLSELGSISDNALSVEEQTLKVLEDQKNSFDGQKEELLRQHNVELGRLDGILSATQAQIDTLKGVDTTGLTIVQVLESIHLAIIAAGENSVNASAAAINEAYKTSLGRTPEKAGMEFWQDSVAKGTSIDSVVKSISGSMEAQIQDLYQKLLGRSADAAGLEYFLKSGSTIGTIYQNIMDSNEYKTHLSSLQSPAATASAGNTGDRGGQAFVYGTQSGSSAAVESLLSDLIVAVNDGNTWTAQMADHIDNATDGGQAFRADLVNNSGGVKTNV